MRLLKLLPILFVLTLFNSSVLAEDCAEIKMNSSVNILKKMKCNAFNAKNNISSSENSSEKKDGILSKIWKKPEWMKKKN